MGGNLKFSKIFVAFICAFSLCAGLAFSQANSAGGDTSNQSAVSANSLPDESTIRLDNDAALGGAAPSAAPAPAPFSTAWVFFKMIFVLALVVVCIYLVMSFMRKKMGGNVEDDDMFLRKVAQVSVAPGKTVQIVTLLEKAYLIGVTDSSIDLLGEIKDKELVDAMNLNADKKQSRARARSFSDVLSLFLNPTNSGATEGERKASSSITDFFKAQKEKFKNGK